MRRTRTQRITIYVNGAVAFVPAPGNIRLGAAQAWVMTHAAVTCVCPACGAAAGELCRGKRGPMLATHFMRRDARRRAIKRQG